MASTYPYFLFFLTIIDADSNVTGIFDLKLRNGLDYSVIMIKFNDSTKNDLFLEAWLFTSLANI